MGFYGSQSAPATIARGVDRGCRHRYSLAALIRLSPAIMSAIRTAPEPSLKRTVPRIWGQMPSRMKVLYVTTLHRTGGWLAEAFRADSATDVLLVETVGVTGG